MRHSTRRAQEIAACTIMDHTQSALGGVIFERMEPLRPHNIHIFFIIVVLTTTESEWYLVLFEIAALLLRFRKEIFVSFLLIAMATVQLISFLRILRGHFSQIDLESKYRNKIGMVNLVDQLFA
jgi:hypothetical protein